MSAVCAGNRRRPATAWTAAENTITAEAYVLGALLFYLLDALTATLTFCCQFEN